MKLYEALEYFLVEQQLKGNTQKTIEGYKGFLNRFVSYAESIGIKETDALTILIVNKYQLYIMNKSLDRNSTKKLTKKSVQTYMRHVRVFIKYCYDKNFVKNSIHNEMIMPRAESPAIEILTDDELSAILSCFSKSETGLRNTAIICLMVDCGLRLNEVANIKKDDVNINNGYICVMGKGQKGRIVPLGRKMRKVLLNYIYKRRMSLDKECDDYFFLSKCLHPVTCGCIQNMIKRVRVKSGVLRLHAHLLRHTFATNYLVHGLGDIYELSRILGHADVKITERYLHIASYYTIIEKRKSRSYLDMID